MVSGFFSKKTNKQIPLERFTLKRIHRANTATLGIIFKLQKEICRTLENPWLDNEKNISCIPLGVYIVTKDDVGKFKYWKLHDVPNRSNIEIHNGNLERDTRGCIIVGNKWGFIGNALAVLTSILTLKRLQKDKIFPDRFELEIVND
jgi:hypothetical protein